MNHVEDIVPLSLKSTHCSSVVLPNLTCCQIAHKSMPMQQAAEAHRQLESGTVHERIILTLQ